MVPYVLLRPIGIKVIESLFPLVDSPNWEVVQMGARKEPNAKRTTKIVLLLSKLIVDLGSFKSEPHQDQNWWHPSAGYLSEIFSISSARRLRLVAGSFRFSTRALLFFEQDTLVAVSTIIVFTWINHCLDPIVRSIVSFKPALLKSFSSTDRSYEHPRLIWRISSTRSTTTAAFPVWRSN